MGGQKAFKLIQKKADKTEINFYTVFSSVKIVKLESLYLSHKKANN